MIKEELHPELELPSDCGVLGMRSLPKSDRLRIKINRGTNITDDQMINYSLAKNVLFDLLPALLIEST